MMDAADDAKPREPAIRAPAVVLLLIGVIVLAHVARVLLPVALSNQILLDYALIPARYASANPGTWIEQAWPFVGYIFIHANLTHLLINNLWLLAFGPIVARRYGATLFVLFFLLCGIASAAVYLACNWGSPNPVIGASGAVSGLMAAAIRMLGSLRRPFDAPAKPTPILSAQVLIFSGIWAAVNVLAGVTGLGTGGQIRLIAWQAHLGGYAAGLLLAGPFDTVRRYFVPVPA